jgi:hypothetical protein
MCPLNLIVALLLFLQQHSQDLNWWFQAQLISPNPSLHTCNTDTRLKFSQHSSSSHNFECNVKMRKGSKKLTPNCELISNNLKIFSSRVTPSWCTLGAFLSASLSLQYRLICASVTLLALSSSAVLSLLMLSTSILACSNTAASESTCPTSIVLGLMVCALAFVSFAEGVPALVTLWPKERVFWEPLGAGPLELRLRRVAGIFAGFSVGYWVGS